MLEAAFSSFMLVAISEMGDKTQLLAFSLAAKFRKPWTILAGIFVATVLNHALASSVGAWVSAHVSPFLLASVLSVTFIAFAVWTLIPDKLEEKNGPNRFGAFLTTTVLFFLAEMGDKTQLATIALAARYQSAIAVTCGTTLGMMVTDGLAVFLGEKLSHRISMALMRKIAAGLFLLFGIASAVTAARLYAQS